MATLAGVLRQFGAAYLREHHLSTPQAKVWRGIAACRTAALGGQQLACDSCGHSHWQYHSCRNRHCPQCGARTKDAWLQGRPANPRWMGATEGKPAFSLVLHTWTQDLQRHIHVHAVMACGVLGADGQWHVPIRKPNFLFPVEALSRVFRAKFMAALLQARTQGLLTRDPCQAPTDWQWRQRQLYKHAWVVYAKTPMGGPTQVLAYLSRYTHRTAIGNERIKATTATEVVFTVRAGDKGGKRRERLPGTDFIKRFLSHVLPTGVKRIRHYGVVASACKGKKLPLAKAALHMPQSNAQAQESARAFMSRVAAMDVQACPVCKTGRLRVLGLRQLPEPGASVLPCNRGPPP